MFAEDGFPGRRGRETADKGRHLDRPVVPQVNEAALDRQVDDVVLLVPPVLGRDGLAAAHDHCSLRRDLELFDRDRHRLARLSAVDRDRAGDAIEVLLNPGRGLGAEVSGIVVAAGESIGRYHGEGFAGLDRADRSVPGAVGVLDVLGLERLHQRSATWGARVVAETRV